MDEDLVKMIKENNTLIKEHLALSKQNAKKIKSIKAYMRRTFIAKIFYWIIIVLVTAGAIYAAKPYVRGAVESYQTLQQQLQATTGIINNPSNLFKNINLFKDVFGS